MDRRRLALASLAAVVVIGVIGAVATWYFFFSSTAPGRADIDQAANVVASARPSGDPATLAPGASATGTDGTWTVDTSIGSFSDYTSSWAGFRVNEVLSNIGNSTAIGRTPDVSGQLTLAGQSLTITNIDVDLTTIKSDQPRRDPAIQRTLETGTFPTATFELSQPISLPQAPSEGVAYNITANGTLTIHGVNNQVSVDLQAKLENGVIVVVGSMPFTFSDYGMSPPTAPIVLSVEDHGTIEFQLFFTR
jgi:polyisoprenoid-binding protein YceI